MNAASTHESVRDYYGRVLSRKTDLKTSACCPVDALPAAHRRIMELIDDEILDRFYGCGSPIPSLLDGCSVLDLGCGTGRDVYLAAKLAGPNGRVIGLDMTEEQLAVARRHVNAQMKRFEFPDVTVDFRHGYIEQLAAAGIADNSVDVVISNCVINLSPDKSEVFREIHRVLKTGGELLFADVFADRRLPSAMSDDATAVGECLGGALYTEDFRRIMQEAGFTDFRVVRQSAIEVEDERLRELAGQARFSSQTIRAFKLDSLEDRCEDYGQAAIYLGTIDGHPHSFSLDDHHLFETGRAMLVCGNTAAMVSETRYAPHFRLIGDRSAHYGLFDCTHPNKEPAAGGGCC